jgi:thioredoxin 2
MKNQLVSCRACGATNRVPAEKEGKEGTCGNCGKPLPPLYLHPVPLTDATFDSFIQRYPLPVLAEFWAPW